MNQMFLIVLTVFLSFTVTAVLGFKVIPWLRKLKYGQTILDIGPNWHKNKQGTPTMGGLMFIVGVVFSVLMANCVDIAVGKDFLMGETVMMKTRMWSGLLMALGFGFIGFMDDYIKVVKKRNLGLTAIQKTLLQLIITVGFLVTNYMSTKTVMYVPFFGEVDFGIFYWIIGVAVIYFMVNAVNLTDGIDGLCSSVTFVVAIGFMIASSIFQYVGINVLAAATAGACGGFLIWNWHPAKAFMGDTGSMFLGGMVIALAYGFNCPFILLPMGIIYIIEAGSVVLQVSYFKLTKGKRIFKMSPIHHHFEMCSWKEEKIVVVFSLIALIGVATGIYLLANH